LFNLSHSDSDVFVNTPLFVLLGPYFIWSPCCRYDKNRSGKLERKEAKAFFLAWFGKKNWKDEQEKEKLFEEFFFFFDSDGSNSLEFSELLRNNFFEDRVLGPARSFIYDLAHLFTHIFFIFRLSVIFFLSVVARLRSRLR
jgi:hypothetical protein